MKKLIDIVEDFLIFQLGRNRFLIRNSKGKYKNHTHIDKKSTCYDVIDMVLDRKVPQNQYLRRSCERLTTDEKYKKQINIIDEKKRDKQQYRNYQYRGGAF